MALTRARVLALCAWLAGCALGCGGSCGSDSGIAPALRGGATLPAAAPPGKVAALRCGDFFDDAELRTLGLDPSRFDPNQTASDPVLGVRCELGKLSATLFDGALYAPMAAELKAAVASGQIKSHPGPTIGSETHWTWMGELHGMLFLSSSKRYAGSLAGRDQALIERLAARLDARMK